MNVDVLIIGAGLSGAVMADQFARKLNKKVLVLEKRNHVAGNCYDYIDPETGILVSEYGPHFFHTNNEEVWEYVNRFGQWFRYDARIVSSVNDRVVPVPVNMETINVLCDQNLKTETETEEWLKNVQVPCENPQNSRDIGLSRVGEKLYESMFRPYTKKQWERYPEDLDPSVLSRIPVRTNTDTRYFSDKYQALPEYGYTNFVENILSHPNITVQLNTEFDIETTNIKYKILIYTGPIDSYFKHLPKLEYRSLRFEKEVIKNYGYFQQNLVVNYPSENVPYTRIVEYKHLPNNESNHTVIVKEYPSSYGEPYYPVPNEVNKQLYKQYQELAEKEKNVHMIGRLANYKYFNMDEAIANALNYFDEHFTKIDTTEIVVAHYNEDVEWLNKNQGNSLHIYSKGNPPRITCNLHILPNIGREPHTYLTYIIDRYDSLPDIVFFTQGNIRDHYSHDVSYFLNLQPNEFSSKNTDLKLFKTYISDDYRIHEWSSSKLEPCEFPGNVWFNKFVNSEINLDTTPIYIYWAAIFSVRKEAILSRSKDYYKSIISQLQTNSSELAHFIERSWYYIFNLQQFNSCL
jgi:UDP-galactopyranose mutase